MPNFFDAFISYGRADSQKFATQLHQRLTEQGLKVWYDQNDIPLAVDFLEQIDDGISKAHNFLFIISPYSVNSEYCLKEIELAVKYNKRIIPLLHVEEISKETWLRRNPKGTDAEWSECKMKGLHSCFPNMHLEISRINWVYFREGVEDFEKSLADLAKLFHHQADYIEQHTKYLVKALEWSRNQKQTNYLLIGQERVKAESWLKVRFKDEQPPCVPTDLHCEYICESTKNAQNLLTQVFICHDEEDGSARDKLVRGLQRKGITTWTNQTDIPSGREFQEEIARGIEGADNFVYLLSDNSVDCFWCKRELNHALKYHKRIIPLLIESLPVDTIPVAIQGLEFFDGTQGYNYNRLIKVLKEDANYYEKHKILLVKAIKWFQQNRNRSLLLRGYNLQHFEAWLKMGAARSLHPPLPLQYEFIAASQGQTTDTFLDVFISYSRADADLARKLNDKLQELGKTTWFDQESIAVGEDFQKEIEKGIENCDNFVFIISPSSIKSPYCAHEVEYASKFNKRLITILHQPVESKDLHPALARVQWIDFRRGDFSHYFNELVRVLDTDREHVRNHTKWSQRAWEWQEKQKSKDLLLRGVELEMAEFWLKQTEQGKVQPRPTTLQKEYITSGREQTKRDQFMVTALWLRAEQEARRAEREATLATLRENAARVKNLLTSNFSKVEGLVLAIAATMKSQEKLGEVIPAVESSLLESIQTARERECLIGHTGQVNSVAFSPDGQYILSGSSDKTIRLWDQEGNPVGQPFTGHKSLVTSVAFSPDGQYILSGSRDGTIRLWDKEGKLVGQPFTGHPGWVTSVAFSPDGQYIVSGSQDKTVRVWDKEGHLVGQIFTGHTGMVHSVAVSPDWQYLVSGGGDGTIRLWDKEGKLVGKPFTGHTGWVDSVAFSPDGNYIVSGGQDKTVRVWDKEGNLVGQPFIGHTNMVISVAFSPDGNYIVSGSHDRTVRVWDRGGSSVGQPLTGHQFEVTSVAFSPDGQYIVSGGIDRTVRVWERQGNAVGQPFTGHKSLVTSVAVSPDGQYIVSGSVDGNIRLWDKEGKLVGQPLTGHTDMVHSVAFSPDGQYIVSGGWDKTVRVWDREGNLMGQPFTGHKSPVYSVAVSPDGQYIVSGSWDKTIRVWDREGKLVGQPFTGHKSLVTSVAVSPDGQYIVSGSADKTVRVWNREGNQVGKPFTGHIDPVWSVAVSPDGQYIVSGSADRTVRVWDREGNQVGQPYSNHTGWVASVAVSPDGQYIVSGSWDRTVRVWDREGNQVGKPFTGHTSWITSVAFSPDGQYLVSGSCQFVKSKDLKKGGVLNNFLIADFIENVNDSDDNTIRLWKFGWQNWLRIGCNQLRFHPVIVNPQTKEAKLAAETCLQYGDWRDEEKAEFLILQGKVKVKEGQRLAIGGQVEEAIAVFKEAQKLDPNIDLNLNLNPNKEVSGEDPEAIAFVFAALGKVEEAQGLARKGKVSEAIAVFKEAQKLDPNIVLNLNLYPNHKEVSEEDSEAWAAFFFAFHFAIFGEVEEARRLAGKGKLFEALAVFKEAQKLDPNIVLNFNINKKVSGEDPEAVAFAFAFVGKFEEGTRLAMGGEVEDAIAVFEELQKLNPEIGLSPYTEAIEKDIKSFVLCLADFGRRKSEQELEKKIEYGQSRSEFKKGLISIAEDMEAFESWLAALAKVKEGWRLAKKRQVEEVRKKLISESEYGQFNKSVEAWMAELFEDRL